MNSASRSYVSILIVKSLFLLTGLHYLHGICLLKRACAEQRSRTKLTTTNRFNLFAMRRSSLTDAMNRKSLCNYRLDES